MSAACGLRGPWWLLGDHAATPPAPTRFHPRLLHPTPRVHSHLRHPSHRRALSPPHQPPTPARPVLARAMSTIRNAWRFCGPQTARARRAADVPQLEEPRLIRVDVRRRRRGRPRERCGGARAGRTAAHAGSPSSRLARRSRSRRAGIALRRPGHPLHVPRSPSRRRLRRRRRRRSRGLHRRCRGYYLRPRLHRSTLTTRGPARLVRHRGATQVWVRRGAVRSAPPP